jgi:hypothetical protein
MIQGYHDQFQSRKNGNYHSSEPILKSVLRGSFEICSQATDFWKEVDRSSRMTL